MEIGDLFDEWFWSLQSWSWRVILKLKNQIRFGRECGATGGLLLVGVVSGGCCCWSHQFGLVEFERGREEVWERERGTEKKREKVLGEREWEFCKMFYRWFFGKIFYKFLGTNFGQTEKFYCFDYILHPNKHLKIGKYFTENILLQNKRSVKEKKGKCKNDTSNKEIYGARFWLSLLVNLKGTKPMG